MLRCCSSVIGRRISFPKAHTLSLSRSTSSDAAKGRRGPTIQTLTLGSLPERPIDANDIPSLETQAEYDNESKPWKQNELPPSLKAVREMMDQYNDYVVLTQLGSFYELYFEHAVEYASKLNLTLAKKHTRNQVVPMAGFPLAHLDRHLKILVQDFHVGVAIVEQFRNLTEIDNEQPSFTRRITRIITPGTLIDEAFLNNVENNYLLSVVFTNNGFNRPALEKSQVGLAWTDLSVGSIFVQETELKNLISTITRIKPIEIIFDEELASLRLETGEWYPELVELKRYFVKYQSKGAKHQTLDFLNDMFNANKIHTKEAMENLSIKESQALRPLLQYIKNHLPEANTLNLQLPQRQVPHNIMQIDSRTSEALELHKRFKDESRKGALLSCIRRTITQSGSRLLSQWISAPSTDIKEIKTRQAFVTLFFKNTTFRAIVGTKLKEAHDISRIVQRFALGRGYALDLVYVSKTIDTANELREILLNEAQKSKTNSKILLPFLNDFDDLTGLAVEIASMIDEESLIKCMKAGQPQSEEELQSDSRFEGEDMKDKFTQYVLPEASDALSKLHKAQIELAKEKEILTENLQKIFVNELRYSSVELKFQPTAGYRLHLKSRKGTNHKGVEELLPDATISSKSGSTRWLNYPKWADLGASLDLNMQKIQTEEQIIITKLKKLVVRQSIPLRKLSGILDWLDVTSSFAVLADANNLVCPTVDRSLALEITNGRHLVVEEGLKRSMKHFTSNDFQTDEDKHLWVISGPNMGGKSTFLRQNAIIVILAQIGCYVPADEARIGVVDKIFSRVGAADDLYNEMSTFMVEMIETSYILKGATKRSLAILDEVGRGTSGKEGLAIAFATLLYMLKENKCRGLFATHFGQELHDLLVEENASDSAIFKKTKIISVNGKLTYDHKLVEGISIKSDAINVAALAGFPKLALATAERTLEKLQ